MADTILSGRWVVYYESENSQKRIWRDTSVTPTTIDSVNALYSALQNHFDELGQMDDGIPMSAQTPTEYTIGIIEAGDKDPWFIDRTSVEYLTGGALKTASWDRNDDGEVGTDNNGIVKLNYKVGGTDFDVTDVGRDIKDVTDNDIGTLLDFNTVLGAKVAWIRPDSLAAANSFDSTASHVLTVQNDSISQVWRVVTAGTVYEADETVDANSAGADDWQFFPTGAAADYALVGYSQKFKKIILNVGTAGVGTYTVAWQYWNGAWTALSGVSDGTTNLKTTGTNNVTFTVPTDWVATSLNGSQSLYYIRALKDTGTVTTTPLGTQGFIGATGSVTQTAVAAVSAGESLWANIYSIGTIESNTHLYIYQNSANLVAYKSTTDWWGDGHIDILVNVKELGTETDEAVIKVYARQYSKTYSYYSVDLTTGGRNPIPLQTGNDLDNQTGYWRIIGSGATGTFVVGETISKSGTNKKGKITAVADSPGTTPTLYYYLIGDPLTPFDNGDTAVTGDTSAATTTIATGPTAFGPSALGTPPTITFGGLADGGTSDINEDATYENYSITIDVNQNTLANAYEYTKYITRRGHTADIDAGAQTIEGQFYLGIDTKISYNTITGTLADGTAVDQAVSGFKGTIVNHNTTDKIITLRDARGTFNQTGDIRKTSDPSNHYVTVTGSAPVVSVTPVTAAPFGTFAGGTFFAAQGIVLTDYVTTEANKFQLKTDEGTVISAPTKVNITISSVLYTPASKADRIAVFRLSGASGTIIKNRYNATTAGQAALATTAVMGSAITTDEPGRALGGVLRLVDVSANQEYRIRFSSWSGTTFTLASSTIASADSGTNTVTIVETGAFASSKVGDIVVNVTRGNAVSYITVITDNDTVTISPAITGQTTADDIRLNVLPVTLTTAPQDTWYVPIIDVYADAATATATVTYLANIPVRVRARNASTDTAFRIIPYEADGTVTTSGLSTSVIRTADTIFQP